MHIKIVKDSFRRVGAPSSKSDKQATRSFPWTMSWFQMGYPISRSALKRSFLSLRTVRFDSFQRAISNSMTTDLVRGLS